jgi:predicted GIY-YIG superfamily endonuclease
VTWRVYVLRSKAMVRTYVGIALDPKARLQQHNGARPGGAKSTRAGRPWRIAKLLGPFESRGEAQRVEAAVKRLRGAARLRYRHPA